MARGIERGLGYLPLDVNIDNDTRIKRLKHRLGAIAVYAYITMLCDIYREGYYLSVDEDTAFILADDLDIDEEEASRIIDTCLSLGLFDKDLYETAHVLTSRAVQLRYAEICSNSRRKATINEYSLLERQAEPKSLKSEETDKVQTSEPIESKITEILFEKNCKSPQKEFTRMKHYYDKKYQQQGGWAAMTSNAQYACAMDWQPIDGDKCNRFPKDFLYQWINLVSSARNKTPCPDNIISDMLNDKLKVTMNANSLDLDCSHNLYKYLEENNDLLCKYIKPVLGRRKLRYICYDAP